MTLLLLTFVIPILIAGMRSSRQQAEVDAFYTNRQMQDREAARFENLREETKALIRTPGWESRIQEVFDKYVKSGMKPAHFRTWMQDQIRAAGTTRGMSALKKAYSNPKNQLEVWRYNSYGAMN